MSFEGGISMFLKIVSKRRIDGIDELVYEVSYNDARYFFVRASVYEKFNLGEYSLSCITGDFLFADKDGNIIPKVKNIF